MVPGAWLCGTGHDCGDSNRPNADLVLSAMAIKVVQRPARPLYVELWTDVDTDWSYAPEEDFLNQVNVWVAQNELGYRTSYNGWKLRDRGAITVFLLRWNLD